jgi:hypothetical protein
METIEARRVVGDVKAAARELTLNAMSARQLYDSNGSIYSYETRTDKLYLSFRARRGHDISAQRHYYTYRLGCLLGF